MNTKIKTAAGLIFPAIGAGLVYVSYSNFYSISADSPYADKNPIINAVLIIVGGLAVLVGVIMLIQVISSNKKPR